MYFERASQFQTLSPTFQRHSALLPVARTSTNTPQTCCHEAAGSTAALKTLEVRCIC